MSIAPMRLLVVDDDFLLLRCIKNVVGARRPDWHVEFFQGPIDVQQTLATEHYDVILSDINMPMIDGLDLLRQAKELAPTTPVVFLTGQRMRYETEAMERGAFAVLAKPIDVDTLFSVIERAAA